MQDRAGVWLNYRMLAYTVDVVGSFPSSLTAITATLTTITAKQN